MDADLPVWPRRAPRRTNATRRAKATRRGGADDETNSIQLIPPLLRRALDALGTNDVAAFARQLRLKETGERQRALVEAAFLHGAANFRLERIRICTALAFVDIAFHWSAAQREEVISMHATRPVYQDRARAYLATILNDRTPVSLADWDEFQNQLLAFCTPEKSRIHRIHYTHETAAKPVFTVVALLRYAEFSLSTWLDVCFRVDPNTRALPPYVLNIAVLPLTGRPMAIPHLTIHQCARPALSLATMRGFFLHDLKHSKAMELNRWTSNYWPHWVQRWWHMRAATQELADYVLFLLLHDLFTFDKYAAAKPATEHHDLFAYHVMSQLMSFEPEATNDGSIRSVDVLDQHASKGILELVFFMSMVRGSLVSPDDTMPLIDSNMYTFERYPSFYAQLPVATFFVWRREYRNNHNLSAVLSALWRYIIDDVPPKPMTMHVLPDNIPYHRVGEAARGATSPLSKKRKSEDV